MKCITRILRRALLAAPLSARAGAQAYPSKTGALDRAVPARRRHRTISRTLAQKLTEAWGQQVIADNRPGSGGTIGLAHRGEAAGRRLQPSCSASLRTSAIAPALYPKLPYDPVKDFTPVTLALTSPLDARRRIRRFPRRT